MNQHDDVELHAYIDSELTEKERAEFLLSIQKDAELARDACALRHLKEQVQLAYANPPGEIKSTKAIPTNSRLAIAASFIMLAFGLIGGWFMGNSAVTPDRMVLLDPQGRGQAPATANSGETRIVFHLTNPDQTLAGELLNDVEQMLTAYEKDNKLLRVEIVSHGEGMDLLREKLSQHKSRISQMANRFTNLTFVACQNTIQRMSIDQGVEITVLPEAQIIDSGVSHVVKRQKEGWSYIRV